MVESANEAEPGIAEWYVETPACGRTRITLSVSGSVIGTIWVNTEYPEETSGSAHEVNLQMRYDGVGVSARNGGREGIIPVERERTP